MTDNVRLARCPKCGRPGIRPVLDLRLAKGDTTGLHRGFGVGSFCECRACSHVWEVRLTTQRYRFNFTAGTIIGLLAPVMLLTRDWRSPLTIGGSIFGLLLGGAYSWAYWSTWRRQQKSLEDSRGATLRP